MPRLTRRPRALTGHSRRLSSRDWAIGASAGAIFLFAALAVGKRVLRQEVDRHLDRADQERAIDRDAERVAPGEPVPREVVFEQDQGYSLVVHPYDGRCKAAMARVGNLGERPSREELLRRLRAEAVEVDKGGTRTLDGAAKAGLWAWAVWHDGPKPVRALIIYQDTAR